ncbi:MAG: hypothetical protein OCD03_14390 [Hyphomicrobiales bacterium]
MSLNITTKSLSSDELINLNVHGTTNYIHYVPGQTLSYSFFTSTNTSIFNSYKAAFGININHDANIWTTNPNWVADVDSAMSGINEIINLTVTKTSDFAASDLRWTAVQDPAGTNVTGYSFLNPSWDMDGQSDGDDAAILLYNKSPFHEGSRAEAELGGGNERTATILHEFGHLLGLSHPHTTVPSDAPFTELNDSKYDLLSYVYSDDVRKVIKTDTGGGGYTISSAYNFGTFVNYTPINIAQLQYLYGASTTNHTSSTTYTLTDAGTIAKDLSGSDGTISVGRAYYSIWDNGGTDEIKYSGNNRVLINLNDATLNRTANDAALTNTLNRVANSDYYNTLVPEFRGEITDSKYYAGGFFSQILTNDDSVTLGGTPFNGKYANTLGGYVIANGVIIENATGGNGNDLIIGNEVGNTIRDNGGHDTVFGSGGNDNFYIGTGNDIFDGGTGADKAIFTSTIGNYQIFVVGNNAIIQDLFGNTYGSNSFTDVESFTFSSTNFAIASLPATTEYERLYADLLNNEFVADAGGIGGNTNDTFWGTATADNLVGELLNDRYEGKTGSDNITFKGNFSEFTFTTGNGSDLVVTKTADSTQYDVLHSVEQLTFDDGAVAIIASDLGLTTGQFITWQADYDFG